MATQYLTTKWKYKFKTENTHFLSYQLARSKVTLLNHIKNKIEMKMKVNCSYILCVNMLNYNRKFHNLKKLYSFAKKEI